MSFCFVRVETEDGTIGYGEACDSFGCSYASVLATIVSDVYAPLLIGAPADSASAIAERLTLATRRRLGTGWAASQARAAIELAVWDVVGKRAGLPVSHLIGSHRDRVEVYASIGFLEEGPAQQHLDGIAALLDRGVTKVKTRIGPDWRRDLVTLGEMRGLLGDNVGLMIDGSETFTVATAALVADALADLDVMWFEEPIPQPSHAGIATLAGRSPVPLAYGEHMYGLAEAVDAMRGGELLVLQPDASTCGLSEARAMAAAAAGFGVRVVPHVCAGPISLAANLHLAATVPAIHLVEYPPILAGVWERFGRGAALGIDAVVDGHLPVPTGPGLGVDLDEEAAASAPYQPPGTRVAGTVGGIGDRFTGDR
jgi:L-alanine-DL-glutamate epimerase-like enolase superfamily enzyme